MAPSAVLLSCCLLFFPLSSNVFRNRRQGIHGSRLRLRRSGRTHSNPIYRSFDEIFLSLTRVDQKLCLPPALAQLCIAQRRSTTTGSAHRQARNSRSHRLIHGRTTKKCTRDSRNISRLLQRRWTEQRVVMLLLIHQIQIV
uniref:Secreted protein n=1 Tax=Anopheles merus TaxID=30066 RepID=A0A182UPZ9_ANOME